MTQHVKMIGLRAVFVLLLVLVLLPDVSVSAEKGLAKITLQLTEYEDEYHVVAQGENLQDVYAYELQLQFDPLRLQLQQAKAEPSGFTVQPMINGDQLVFAHTKLGSAAGISGDAKLADLTFKRIRGGDAVVALTDVKLVNSTLKLSSSESSEQLTLPDDTPAPALNDIEGHWGEQWITTAVELGFVSGYSDGTFRPNEQITRMEYAVLLTRALQLPRSEQLSFTDEENIPQWAKGAVATAHKAGIIQGYNDNTFRGMQPVSRAELAVMMNRGLAYVAQSQDQTDAHAELQSEQSQAGTMDQTLGYVDAAQIPLWAQSATQQATVKGLLQGRSNNYFMPLAPMTRAEAVTATLRMLYVKAGLNLN